MNRRQARLAIRVCDYLDAHPEKHIQKWWWVLPNGDWTATAEDVRGCGTAGRIASWTVHLSRARLLPGESVPSAAERILGLGFMPACFSSTLTPETARAMLREMAEEVLRPVDTSPR